MIKPNEKVFDDIARMAGGAVTIMSGITRQVREEIRARVDEMATRLDLVPREDLEMLEKRIEALEAKLAGASKAAPKRTNTRTNTRTSTASKTKSSPKKRN